MTHASQHRSPLTMRVAGACARALLERSTAGSVAARVVMVSLAAAAIAAATLDLPQPAAVTEAVPHPVAAAPPVAPLPRRPGAVSIEQRPHIRPVVDSEPLLLALDLFQQAVDDRVATESDAARTELDQALRNLDRATRVFVIRAGSIAGSPPVTLAPSISSYTVYGNDLVSIADQQRAALRSYSVLLTTLTGRVAHSSDAPHTLLGRLFARSPLLDLRADLAAITRAAPLIAAPAGETAVTVAPAPTPVEGADDPQAALVSEQDALSNLEVHRESLVRSQSEGWYQAVHADLAHLASLRNVILTLNLQLRARTRMFGEQSLSVTADIPRELGPAQVAAPWVQRAPRTATAASGAVSSGPQLALEEAPRTLVAAVPPVVSAQPGEPDTHSRSAHRWTVWVTASAFLLLLYLLIGTAAGIVLPVRRLIGATKRLADGEDQVHVRRGGLKELDKLVVAFNTMTSALALAKANARDSDNQFRATISAQTQRLEEQAKRDPLTGLDNRRELLERLDTAIERAQATDQLVGVLFLDIDNFKYINDSTGHLFGDRLLISLSERLQQTTRPFGRAGRLGGDEFTVIVDRAHDIEEIQAAGLAVLRAFQEPLVVDGQELNASVSVGASIYPYHARDAATLLQAADAALFRAKALGRSKLSLYSAELAELGAARLTTEQGLRRAIERGEFELVFQPEVSAATLDVAVVEALIRWRMADGSLLGPDHFLSIAEDSGLIVEISNWVLQAAVEAAARWYHGAWPEARVAINVSSRQLLDQRFVDRLQALLQEHRLPARCIEIELTESVLQTGPATIEALKRLRSKGVAIALDDFGTGYSSFASLERLPLTRVKLDRSLIASIDVNPRSAAIARGIISMCQGLGLEITAEGVERTAQLALLIGHRLMYLQGFLFARPVVREELMPLMTKVTDRAHALVASSQLLSPAHSGTVPKVVELAPGSVRRASEAG